MSAGYMGQTCYVAGGRDQIGLIMNIYNTLPLSEALMGVVICRNNQVVEQNCKHRHTAVDWYQP